MSERSVPETAPVVDIVIVGAGVVGAAIARRLSQFTVDVVVIDAAEDVGAGTSKANTAILHTGFDAIPGTVESRLVADGYRLLLDYARRAGIAVELTGALLVAWTDEQLSALPALAAKAERNGYRSVRPVDVEELYRREPHLGPGALGALEVPDEGIIDPWSPVIAFAREAVGNGAVLLLGETVTGLRRIPAGAGSRPPIGPGWLVSTSRRTLVASVVVNAAGLQSDTIDRLAGQDRFTVTPRRGELIVFDKLARPLVNHVLLPVPTAMGKGVLVSPTVFGNVVLGPTAEDLDDRTATGSTHAGITGLLEKGRWLVPDLVDEEVTAVYAGLRAATEHSDYQLFHEDGYVCIGGIRSTGLTSSMAIAERVVDFVTDAGITMRERPEPATVTMPNLGEAFPRPYQDPDAIDRDPAAGVIVCHCERVTRAELLAACRSAVPAPNLDGLRRRTRALTGRCQGFYCGATVADLLATERRTTVEHVLALR